MSQKVEYKWTKQKEKKKDEQEEGWDINEEALWQITASLHVHSHTVSVLGMSLQAPAWPRAFICQLTWMHAMMYESVCLYGCNKPVTVITTSPSQHEWRCRSLVGVVSVQLIKTDRKSERWLLGVTKWRIEEWKLAERLNCLSCGLVCCEGGRWWMINGRVFCSSASHPGALLGAGLGGDLLQKRPSRGKWGTL